FRDRLAAALTALFVPVAILAIVHEHVFYWAAGAAILIAIALLQRSQLRFIAAADGPLFALRCFPRLLLYNLTGTVGLVLGLIRAEQRRDRWLIPGVVACAALI